MCVEMCRAKYSAFRGKFAPKAVDKKENTFSDFCGVRFGEVNCSHDENFFLLTAIFMKNAFMKKPFLKVSAVINKNMKFDNVKYYNIF